MNSTYYTNQAIYIHENSSFFKWIYLYMQLHTFVWLKCLYIRTSYYLSNIKLYIIINQNTGLESRNIYRDICDNVKHLRNESIQLIIQPIWLHLYMQVHTRD